MAGQPIKLDDVARLAGVSAKTVSRVVNGEAHVSRRTRELVERAIAALDYRPNLAARSLVTARTFLIGAISPRLENFYFHELHGRSIRACKERGFHLVIEEIDPESPDLVQRLEKILRHMRFEGIILAPPIADNASVLDMLDSSSIRYVRISPATDRGRSDSVSADEARGISLLAEHLWSLGHRRIALVGGPDKRAIGLRHDLLKDALIKRGCDPQQIQSVPLDWRARPIEVGRQIAAALLSQAHRPTAIFSFNDEVAAGVIGYALEHGLSVPRDLSVAGFDDGDVAQAIWPQLTTIRQPIDEIARAAVSLLVEPATEGKVRDIVCPVEFVVRGSTGRAERPP